MSGRSAVPVVAFVGRSGSGKTTLLCSVVRILVAKGIRVAAVKHAHKGFEIDYPGKDSMRLREAGANPVLLLSPTRRAWIEEAASPAEPDLREAIASLARSPIDLLLVEGFRAEGVPKIELFLPSLGQLFCGRDPDLLAVASEGGVSLPDVPLSFDRNDAEGVAALILQACGLIARSKDRGAGSPPRAKGPLSLKEARRMLGEAMAPDRVEAVEEVSLSQSVGRILATDLISPVDLPSAPTAAMDGYATRAAPLGEEGREFSVAGTSAAGSPFFGTLPEGSCVRIFTGALLPEGTDLVIPQEEVVLQGKKVLLPGARCAGENVRLKGESFARGQGLLSAGTRIGARTLALLAAIGREKIPVRRRLRLGLLCTGKELRAVGESLGHGDVYDSNRVFLSAALSDLGVDLTDGGIVDDDPEILEERLDRLAEQVDLLVTTGGVSVGEGDYVGKLLAERNAVVFRQIAVKPGRPFLFARWRGRPLFGLPGTPAAVFVLFYDLIRPLLGQCMGESPLRERMRLPVLSRLHKRAGRTEYWAGRLVAGSWGEPAFCPVSRADGAGLLPAASADLLALLPEESEWVEVGERVETIFLPQ
ncbi:MAG: molybdopterin-guanine dinucleotide biosynthesis protein B [Methylacidiphilaceae bacterium]|nr:molybdopterin-guanine dinucleotide biosynthesis protein B [Candidatus Methylacidiphilaceae bacterium]